MLIEIGALALCVCFGGLVAMMLRRRARQEAQPVHGADRGIILPRKARVAALPVIMALVLVLLARSLLQAAHFDVTLLERPRA